MFNLTPQLLTIRCEPFIGRIRPHLDLVFLIPASVVVALLTVYAGGNPMAGIGLLGLALFLTITVYRLDWGLFIFIGMVLLFDQIENPEVRGLGRSFTTIAGYHYNIKAIDYLPSVSIAMMNPLELHLALLLSLWTLIAVVKRKMCWHRIHAWGAALLFLAALIAALAHGLGRGGVLLPAIWETRAMFYLVIVFFFVPQVLHTPKHIQTFWWVCIGVITFKALQGIQYYIKNGFSFEHVTTFTNHEDPVFMLLVFGLLIGLVLFKGYPAQKWTIFLVLPVLAAGFYVGQRRAAYAAISTTILVFAVVLSGKDWKRFMRPFIPLAIVGLLYCAAFWNSAHPIGSFAQIIKSGFITNPSRMSREDYYSNLYRDIEKYNLAMTARRTPVTGIGFGQKYDQPIPMLHLGLDLLAYLAHNAILWLIVKMGAVGYFCFFFFVTSIVFYGSTVFPKLHDPYLKAVCLVSIACVLNQVVVSYFDLQLTYYRNMILMGSLAGMLSRLEPVDRQLSPSLSPQYTGV